MKKIDKNVKAHLMICGKQKPGKPCCFDKGSVELFKELKSYVKNQGWKEFIKVSQTSCLGHCESGITACFYPENLWFHQISKDNLNELKEYLRQRAEEAN